MTADNDINRLFENHTIKEIEIYLSKTRMNIERKKEDLRIMVGERYRDLIVAADTIENMRESAETIYKNIGKMEGLCEALQQRGLIGFKTKIPPAIDSSRYHGSRQQYSLAIQIKLLVDIPVMMWDLTEKKDYLEATQLLLLSQQVHTALQLSPNADKVLEKFPVISRQWSNISQFRSTLTRGCSSLIQNEVKDSYSVIKALAAMVLLEGKDMNSTLKLFLDLRKKVLVSSLLQRSTSLARVQLVEFTELLISSLVLMYRCFYGNSNERCQLVRELLFISGQEESDDLKRVPNTPISLLHESSVGFGFLPKSILEFRCKPTCDIKTLSEEYIRQEARKWMQVVRDDTSDSVFSLLRCTTSIKSLTLIRESLWETQKRQAQQSDWTKISSSLLGQPSFSPWDFIVRREALTRAQHLVKKELETIRGCLVQMVVDTSNEILTSPKVCEEEGDVCEFLWSEASSDIPDQGTWSAIGSSISRTSSNFSVKTGLFYKTRGFTKRIQNICKTLNTRLAQITEDVSKYGNNLSKCEEWLTGELESSSDDYGELLKFLESETLVRFKRFVADVETIGNENLQAQEKIFNAFITGDANLDLNSSIPTAHGSVVLNIGRLCQAVPSVCHQVRVCAVASILGKDLSKTTFPSSRLDSPTWQELHRVFNDSTSSLVTKFLCSHSKLYGALLKKEFLDIFSRRGNGEELLLLFPVWEDVKIEEEGDAGSIHHTSIRVPTHPSPPFARAAMRVCSAVNTVCPHTLAKCSHLDFVCSLCADLLSAYDELDSFIGEMNQTAALQLVFDLKVIQNLLFPRDNKKLGDRIVTLIHKFESRVDPFDLDVFSPHLNSRVKVTSQRLMVLLGTLIPRGKQPLTTRGVISSQGNNSLPIVGSVEIPRFSNVPIPFSGGRRKHSSLMDNSSSTVDGALGSVGQNKKTSEKDAFVTSSEGISSRSSSSIFSVMSSSWFGDYLNS